MALRLTSSVWRVWWSCIAVATALAPCGPIRLLEMSRISMWPFRCTASNSASRPVGISSYSSCRNQLWFVRSGGVCVSRLRPSLSTRVWLPLTIGAITSASSTLSERPLRSSSAAEHGSA